MDADTKRGYKAMLVLVALFGYLQLWIWLWQSSKDDLFHSLVVVAFIAMLLIIWAVYKKLGTKRSDAPSTNSSSKSQDFIERNQSAISKYRNQIYLNTRTYYIENLVRDCIEEVARAEKRPDLGPGYKWLSQWKDRTDLPPEYRSLADYLKNLFQQTYQQLRKEEDQKNALLKQIHDEQVASSAEQIIQRNQDLIDKFLEIGERKVSVLDAYGDEQWDLLPDEVLLCMKKIAQREGRSVDWSDYSKAKRKVKRDTDFVFLSGRYRRPDSLIPEEYQLMEKKLTQFFNEYHESTKARPRGQVDVDALSGVEFETHISTMLRSSGYDVSGTPTTGDQGADLIAKKNGKTYIIQAKRYQGTVGNKAVQEVISAVSYYGGDEGWVITNSSFTPSAVALAQKANITLIDGVSLRTKPL